MAILLPACVSPTTTKQLQYKPASQILWYLWKLPPSQFLK